jgi:hypothetical protein
VPGPLYVTKEEGDGVDATVSIGIAAILMSNYGSIATLISLLGHVTRGMLYRGNQARDCLHHT